MILVKEFSGNQSKAERNATEVSAQAHEHYSGSGISLTFYSKEPRQRRASVKRTIVTMEPKEAETLCQQLQELIKTIKRPL